MTKFNQIQNASEIESVKSYINTCWNNLKEARLGTWKRVTNYLFVLNTGGLLATLTYISTNKIKSYFDLPILMFSLGILFCLLHAAIDYYATENLFKTFRVAVSEYYESKIDWDYFLTKINKAPRIDWIMHVLGWGSGIVFFIGLYSGIKHIY